MPGCTLLVRVSFFAFLISVQTSSAQTISGSVVDEQTGESLPFATVGLLRANKGTTAGRNGLFTIAADFAYRDTLVISYVGYETRKLPLQANLAIYRIALQRRASPLLSVTVRKTTKTSTLPWSRGRSDFTLTTTGITTQVAQLLEAPEANARLDAVTIATGSSSLFGERPVSRFQVRIYDYDSTLGQPGQELCDSLIEVSGRGILVKDLRKYGILLPQKRFFVAVQWLLIEENGPDTNGSYEPRLRMLNTEPGEGRSWWQSYNRRWGRQDADAGITATISY